MLRDRHKARPEAGGREVVLHLSVRGEAQAGPELLKYFCPSQSFLSECGLQVGKGDQLWAALMAEAEKTVLKLIYTNNISRTGIFHW